MNPSDILVRFISLQLKIPVYCWDGSRQILTQFEKQHCFLSHAQAQLTADTLHWLCQSLHNRRIYELRDLLGVQLLMFQFEENAILVGPFVENAWNETLAIERLTQLNLPATYKIPYKSYYCSYIVLETEHVLDTILSAIEALKPQEKSYDHQVLFGIKEGTSVAPLYQQEHHDFTLIVQQYQAENELIHMIRQGKTKAAIAALQNLSPLSMGSKHPVIQSRDIISGHNILRTLIRKAAESAGVHPTIIDAIAQSYAQKSYSIKDSEQSNILIHKMIQEFCEAVQAVLNEDYSPPVRRAVDYIILHLSMPITMKEIASISGLTPSRLSHVFKEQTNRSVMQYVAEKRCHAAADLIATTDLAIQDISMHVGYPDSNYFVKVFRSQFNITPTEYRKTIQPFNL